VLFSSSRLLMVRLSSVVLPVEAAVDEMLMQCPENDRALRFTLRQ